MKHFILALLFLLTCSIGYAQLTPQSVSIPMRDGKSLAGDLYLPNSTDTFPTIFIFTPYGKVFYKFGGLPFGINKDISKSKYAILVVDWRCRFASLSACAAGSDNGEDGYDVVEWAASQSWSTGKIGTWGPSALGNVQFMTAKEQPPHLTCAVPEVASPLLEYKKYHPGGVMEAASFKTLNEKLFPGSYDLVIKNPYYNNTWKFVEATTDYHKHVKVPMLLIGGWYDHNTVQDLEMLDLLIANSHVSVRDKHKLLMGPWVHGGTGQASLGTSFQGDFSFPNAAKWNDSLSLVFFDHYLRGIDNGYENNAKFTYYQIGDNEWHTSSAWPPITPDTFRLYLNSSGLLSDARPSNNNLIEQYLYDPQDPSPSVGGKTLSDNLDQGPYDQSIKVESRNDVVLFTTNTLTEDIIVQGEIKVNLNVSSDRKDTDFAIRLTEVFPDGKSIQIEEDILRMRFRNGFALQDTAFMKLGEKYAITLTLDDIAYTFKTGNKIRLVVSSSNYPMYNRNMNNGGEMYPDDKVDSVLNPLIANNTLHFGADYVSSIEMPFVTKFDNLVEKGKEAVKVYPVPSKDILFIDGLGANYNYSITSVKGQMIQEGFNYSDKISIADLPNGIYFLNLESITGERHQVKFIKE